MRALHGNGRGGCCRGVSSEGEVSVEGAMNLWDWLKLVIILLLGFGAFTLTLWSIFAWWIGYD